MKAVIYRNPLPINQADSLLDVELPGPKAGDRDLLVEVRAISVNPADVKIGSTVDPKGRDKVLGWDACESARGLDADWHGKPLAYNGGEGSRHVAA